VHAAFEALGPFFEMAQVNPIVFLGEEAGDTVVSPLNDVPPCSLKAELFGPDTGVTIRRAARPVPSHI
jgi:hypothetical protein